MKKTIAAISLAGILALSAGTVAAQAAPYPAPPTGTVSSGTITAGSAVVFSGSGFLPGEDISITVTSGDSNSPTAAGALGGGHGGMSMSVPIIIKSAVITEPTVKADANGNFSTSVILGKPGTYTLTATGLTSGRTVSMVVTVVGAAAGAGNGNGSGTSGTASVAGGSGNGLAYTGVDSSVLIWSLVGVGALGAGIGTVVVSRRRSKLAEA